MPIPYRRTPRAAEVGLAAYLDIVWLAGEQTFYGGLLLIDGKGQPQEFVHNFAAAPLGSAPGFNNDTFDPLWPDELVRRTGVTLLTHSLFDACRREPDILVCLSSLGTPEFCMTEISPSMPFAQTTPMRGAMPAEWSWMNSPPSSGMRASLLAQELVRCGFIIEPFERLHEALRLIYPVVSWESKLILDHSPVETELVDIFDGN